jgi:hypothetical protein
VITLSIYVKFILLKMFNKENIFIKLLSIIKNSIRSFKLIKKISLKYSIILIPNIIYGHYFINKNYKNFIQNKKTYFEKKYKFSYDDWFSANIIVWENIVNKINEINYLEIGSFEGRSTVFIKELNNLKSLMAIDIWEGADIYNNINFNKVYENFKNNINIRTNNDNTKNINFLKISSDDFFKNNKVYYNLIYIDGSHHYEQVKKDFINSFNFLENNGYIICDDFMWFYYSKIEDNPMKAILECYDLYKQSLKVVFLNHQIIFKKIIG